ncbi:MAG: hypothetical protein DCF27_01165 [Lysobacteraceae bacterium]|nr:MAG: hypothetical protein DCF27_01165 [Xanthomonadaceae bacterium]
MLRHRLGFTKVQGHGHRELVATQPSGMAVGRCGQTKHAKPTQAQKGRAEPSWCSTAMIGWRPPAVTELTHTCHESVK